MDILYIVGEGGRKGGKLEEEEEEEEEGFIGSRA